MSRVLTRLVHLAGAASLLLAAGCGSGSSSSGEPTAELSIRGGESATPSTTPAAVDEPGGDGLTFTDHPDLDGKRGRPAQAYVDYYEAVWQALTTNQVPAELSGVATGPLVQGVTRRIQDQRADEQLMGGTVSISFEQVERTSTSVTFAGCLDESGMTKTVGGKPTAIEGLAEQPTQTLDIVVGLTQNGWAVIQSKQEIAPC